MLTWTTEVLVPSLTLVPANIRRFSNHHSSPVLCVSHRTNPKPVRRLKCRE